MTNQTAEVAKYIKGLEGGQEKGPITEDHILLRMLRQTRTPDAVAKALKQSPSPYGFLWEDKSDGFVPVRLVCDLLVLGQAPTRLQSMRDDGTTPLLKLRRYLLPEVGGDANDLSRVQALSVGVDVERLPFEKLVGLYGQEQLGKAAVGHTIKTLLDEGHRRDAHDRRSKDDKPWRLRVQNGHVEAVLRRSLGPVQGEVEDFATFEAITVQDEKMQEKGRQMATPSVRYPSKDKGRDDR